jgi:hypothetical protein
VNKLYSKIEAAIRLNTSPYHINRLIEEGELPQPRIEPGYSRPLFLEADLLRYERRKFERRYAPTTDIKQVVLKPGERLA